MARDLAGIKRTNPPVVIDIPEVGVGGCGDGVRAMGRDEHLGAAVLEFLDQRALPIRLETTLDLVDDRDWLVALTLLGDGERCEAACSDAPARQSERDTGPVCVSAWKIGSDSLLMELGSDSLLMELAVWIALDSGKESKACEVVVRRYWSRLDLLRKA